MYDEFNVKVIRRDQRYAYFYLAYRIKNLSSILPIIAKKSNMCDKFSVKSIHILQQLFDIIVQRRNNLPPDSYTASLFHGGIEKIVAKILEETQEFIEATTAISPDSCGEAEKRQVVHEAADLMYHFLVLLAACGVTFDDVEKELARRFGVSGLVEKAARKKH